MIESAYQRLHGDSERKATIQQSCLQPSNEWTTEPTIELDPERYQTLLGSLRYAIDELNKEIDRQRSRPGGMSIFRDRIRALELKRDQTIEVLVAFDI